MVKKLYGIEPRAGRLDHRRRPSPGAEVRGDAPDDPGPGMGAGHGPGPVQPPSRRRSRPPRASSSSPTLSATRRVVLFSEGQPLGDQGQRPVQPAARHRPRPGRSDCCVSDCARTTASGVRLRGQVPPPSGRGAVAACGLFLTADRRLLVADGRAGRVTHPRPQRQGASALGKPGARYRPVRDASCRSLRRTPRRSVYVAEIDGRRLQKFTAKWLVTASRAMISARLPSSSSSRRKAVNVPLLPGGP